MNLDLKNKVGIITGASRGIGAEIAREFAREGCSLLLTARSAAELARLASEVHNLGGRARAHPADLCKPSVAAALVSAAVAEFGRIDFLVTAAATSKPGDFLDLTDDDWQEGFALKFFSHMRLIRAAWPQLKASSGSIVMIAGAAGRTPNNIGMIAGAVNSTLMNMTKALAARALPDGIRVNAVNPGPVRTDRFMSRLQKTAQATGRTEAEALRKVVAENNIIRIGEPEDIACMVSFIVSRRGSYIHGALIDVDGGRTKSV